MEDVLIFLEAVCCKAVLTERFFNVALDNGSKGTCDKCPITFGKSQTGLHCQVAALELKIPFMTDWRTGWLDTVSESSMNCCYGNSVPNDGVVCY